MVGRPEDCRPIPGACSVAYLGPRGLRCADAEQDPGCWSCHSEPWVPCCVRDVDGYVQEYTVPAATCESCGGWSPYADPSGEPTCYPPPGPADYRRAGPDRVAPDGLRWTFDLETPIAYGLDPETGLVGRAGLTSAIPARTVAPSPGDQPCQPTAGRLVVRDDGYAYVETCCEPTGDADSQVMTYGALWPAEVHREPQDDPTEYLEPGYSYFLGCVQTPRWTEAIYRSYKQLCEGPIV